MKYFLDTEFIELGPKHPIRLISIGLVREDGKEYYAIDQSAPLHLADSWVKDNVIPKLNWEHARPREKIILEILDFIGQDPEPHFWGYYCDYDWVVFCQLFGKMILLPPTWPMFCLDIKQEAEMMGIRELPKLPGTWEHNALDDAREIKFRHEWLWSKR